MNLYDVLILRLAPDTATTRRYLSFTFLSFDLRWYTSQTHAKTKDTGKAEEKTSSAARRLYQRRMVGDWTRERDFAKLRLSLLFLSFETFERLKEREREMHNAEIIVFDKRN